jgi:hypothetical protein
MPEEEQFMTLKLDLERVKANVGAATTEDLLDRATVFRDGTEPEALELIDAELFRRGITAAQINAHAENKGNTLRSADGAPLRCWKCQRPAIAEGRQWVKLWGILPLFPRTVGCCAEHRC